MIETLRFAFAMVPERLRRWWLLMPVMAVIGGAIESLAAGSIFLLVRILDEPSAIASTPVLSSQLGRFSAVGPERMILIATALVVAFHLFKNVVLVGMQYLRHRIMGESSAELACAMLRGYLLLPLPFHFRRNSAELIRNTTLSVTAVFGALESGSVILTEVMVGLGIVCVLVLVSPGVTLATLVALALLLLLLLRFTGEMARRRGSREHALGRNLQLTLQNALGGMREIKALGREEYFYRAFAEAQREKLSLGYLSITLGAIPQFVIETAFVVGALVMVTLLTLQGEAGGDLLSLVGLFAYAGFRMIPMANRLTWRLNGLREGKAAVEALHADYRLVMALEGGEFAPDPAPSFRDTIVLDRVSYTYPGNELPTLEDVNLTIRRGESLGIVGATGAGKSTLVDLVVGLLVPTTGEIQIDGKPAEVRGPRWIGRIGYVPQSIFLVDDTLRRNVALGIPDEQIDEERVREALRMASLEAFANRLPRGLDTLLGERGERLSGGERQRVGIARALYHRPELVVLDEATSALDAATEAEVSAAIDGLSGAATLLVIAHRPSAVRGCDRVVLLREGRIAAVGNFQEIVGEGV